jgi:hypothetical protein
MQGRFAPVAMDELLAVARYVELNPNPERPARRTSRRLALVERVSSPRRTRLRPGEGAPVLALAPDGAAFLAGGLGVEGHPVIRAGERTRLRPPNSHQRFRTSSDRSFLNTVN